MASNKAGAGSTLSARWYAMNGVIPFCPGFLAAHPHCHDPGSTSSSKQQTAINIWPWRGSTQQQRRASRESPLQAPCRRDTTAGCSKPHPRRGQSEMAGAEEVRVLGTWQSPYVLRPRIALNLKKVEYEFVVETMNPKSELLLKSNPVYKKIPVLLHNGNPVCESLIIVQYVDEAWSSGHPILPAYPYDRALARFWASYIDDKWFPSLIGIVKAQTDDDRASSTEQLLAGLQLLEEAFATCSKGKPFFGGDAMGYLDIVLGCYLGGVRATEQLFGTVLLDEARTPQLAAWADRFCAHEAVREVMPETEKLVEFAKGMLAKWKAAPAPAN